MCKIACLTPAVLVILIIMITAHLIGRSEPIIVHKTMNYNDYNIVIISKRCLLPLEGRNLYADIWLEEKKIKRYHLYELDGWDDYYERIKDITILPDSKEIKVEFTERGIFGSKTRTYIDLYKIE